MQTFLGKHAELRITPYYDDFKHVFDKKQHFVTEGHGMGHKYADAIRECPDCLPSCIELETNCIIIGRQSDIDVNPKIKLFNILQFLRPWRKGPFRFFGIEVDSEWVSWLKWNRLKDHIRPLAHRRILDIGSSNGYYLFRMAAQAPTMVLGIEPFVLYYYQFQLLQRYIQAPNVYCLPLQLEDMPVMRHYFDTIFCMGVLPHRKSPLDSLREIHTLMRPGGELVLETLTIDGPAETALCPQQRYAKMHNVFFLPTISCLQNWLHRSGFKHIRHIDTTRTTLQEQRRTPWILSESLDAFLDPAHLEQTVEGYPAPQRSILLADAK
jgi:tRNA (mo5U34)-methyltransferase